MLIIINAPNTLLDGCIMELNDSKFFLVEKVFQNDLVKDKGYSKEELETKYGSFSYKELLFD